MTRWFAALALPLLWGGVLASAAAAIYCKHTARGLFVELESLTADAARHSSWTTLNPRRRPALPHGPRVSRGASRVSSRR